MARFDGSATLARRCRSAACHDRTYVQEHPMTLAGAPERTAPHDREAEQYVLGSVLIDRDAIFKIADVLRPDDFYIARNQRIYGAALQLLERRERIDPLTIQMELARREELDRVGGAAYLRELVEMVPVS